MFRVGQRVRIVNNKRAVQFAYVGITGVIISVIPGSRYGYKVLYDRPVEAHSPSHDWGVDYLEGVPSIFKIV